MKGEGVDKRKTQLKKLYSLTEVCNKLNMD